MSFCHCLLQGLAFSESRHLAGMKIPPELWPMTVPNSLLALPTMPSLGNCFPCGSVNLGKYVIYSSALSWRVCWRTSIAMSMRGQGMSPFLMDDNAGNAAAPRVPKTRTQHFIYARRDTKDGPLEIIPPKDSMWYTFMSAILISTKMQSSRRHFAIASAFRTRNTSNCWKIYALTNCLTDVVGISSTIKSVSSRVAPSWFALLPWLWLDLQ